MQKGNEIKTRRYRGSETDRKKENVYILGELDHNNK